jgi:hypothetical protein
MVEAGEDPAMNADKPFEGGCTCRAVRYRMTTKPMFVHCCHCRWCPEHYKSSDTWSKESLARRAAALDRNR